MVGCGFCLVYFVFHVFGLKFEFLVSDFVSFACLLVSFVSIDVSLCVYP